jgi:cytoskeleton protein RodZ
MAVFLGNAEGVRLTVDGAPIAVRPAARRDGTARLTVGGGAG